MKKVLKNIQDSYREVRWQLFQGYWKYSLWTVISLVFVLGVYIGCQL